MAEKERKARLAELFGDMKPANMAYGPESSSASTDGNVDRPQKSSVGVLTTTGNSSPNSGKKNAACNDLAAKVENIKSEQRAGGRLSYMEELNQKMKDAERMMKQLGCY